MEGGGLQGPIMVAMKGYPGTGKTTLACALSPYMNCPVINLDCVRDCVANLEKLLPASPKSSPSVAKQVNDLSFEAICRIAMRQIRFGLHLIIDSPLSCRSHLDQLLQLSSSTCSHLVIIECKPQDKYEWQRRLEGHRPSEDLEEQLSEWFDGTLDYDTAADVSKIIVNTTDHVKLVELALAVQTVCTSAQIRRIDYHDFVDKLSKGVVLTEGEAQRKERLKREEDAGKRKYHPHVLATVCDEHKNEADRDSCRACLKPISGQTYKCTQCELCLHKLCAELPHKTQIKPQDLPPFLQSIPRHYSFPEVVRCSQCETPNKDDDECPDCIFETFIRSRLLPSVLHHPCHEHTLSVKIYPISALYRSGFRCKACGDPGEHVSYHCYECGFECHIACALLPHTNKQEHHLHPLTITFLPTDDDDSEFSCDACEATKNAAHWMYYCARCEFRCHLSCMEFVS